MANLNSPRNQGFALRDYHHAAKTFTQEPGYTKTPYTGFNFHVSISFNNLLGKLRGIETKDISVLVKAADLPETQFETETLNQYNRKRIVNKRVVYQPIDLEFHDDIANNIRNMWIAYNQHYNADSNYTLNSTWNIDDVYANYSQNRRYGLDNGNSLPFINKIEIYSMGNTEYSKMLLVNPVINSAKFDNHEYSEGAKIMSLKLTVEYENIIYSAGTTDQIADFGKNNIENYDQNESLLESVDLSTRMSNVSIRRNSGLTAADAVESLENGRFTTPDTAIQSSDLSNSRTSAADIDPLTGNVPKYNKNNNNPVESSQYDQSKSQIQLTGGNGQYSFPDARSLGDGLLGDNNIPQSFARSIANPANTSVFQTSNVLNSNNVSSNGGNISSGSLRNNNSAVRSQQSSRAPTVYTSAEQNTAEIIIDPVIPNNLTPAERQLFVSSYPPLPSTDRRVTKPPYV